MILDGHIHIASTKARREPFIDTMKSAGINGGIVISAHPETPLERGEPYERRIEHVMDICRDERYLFPFFYINPVDADAARQVEHALRCGVAGFKIICGSFYPSDPRCLETCRLIAQNNKPVLFHSGILWDGINPSGDHNRPVQFEAMMTVPGLRFALAHISWPWCDECVAVYGKLDNAFKLGLASSDSGEMFIDNTPGTPKIFRAEALKKVLFSGYDAARNMYFGTDNFVEDYNVDWARDWIATDTEIYDQLGLDARGTRRIFSENLLRFVSMEPRV